MIPASHAESSKEDLDSKIYVGSLPFELTEGDIISVFSQFGEIDKISLARDRDTGKSRGFCFISYEDKRSCQLAVENLNETTIINRRIKVRFAFDSKLPRNIQFLDVAPRAGDSQQPPVVEAHQPRDNIRGRSVTPPNHSRPYDHGQRRRHDEYDRSYNSSTNNSDRRLISRDYRDSKRYYESRDNFHERRNDRYNDIPYLDRGRRFDNVKSSPDNFDRNKALSRPGRERSRSASRRSTSRSSSHSSSSSSSSSSRSSSGNSRSSSSNSRSSSSSSSDRKSKRSKRRSKKSKRSKKHPRDSKHKKSDRHRKHKSKSSKKHSKRHHKKRRTSSPDRNGDLTRKNILPISSA